jgi:DNA-binding CsgD family transcriptional regulator/tetratricopeptide (TPR) repeat protein
VKTTSDRSLLLGRDDDLAAITSAAAAVAAGTAQVVLISGEPGIGKSALIDAALAKAPTGMRLLRGRGHELERERPFGLLLDALPNGSGGDPPSDEVRALLRSDPSVDQGEFALLRFRIIETILDLLDGWAGRQPVLLALEDIHWADPSSLLLVGQLARRLADRPVGVVATHRPSRDLAVLDSLDRELSSETVHRIRLHALPEAVVHDLARRQLGGRPGPGLAAALAGAGGNPFFVTELLHALVDDRAVEAQPDGEVELTVPEPPPSLRLTILRRLGFLPERTLQVLRSASVLGSRFHLDDLSVVLERPASVLLDELEDAQLAGFLAMDDDEVAFRHDLVRDAIHSDLPRSVRAALHVQTARRLAVAGRDPASVAPHFLAGASPGDPEAIEWLERAARDALSTAPGVAAELLTAAVGLIREPTPDRDRIEVELATALTWAGRLDAAERLLEDLTSRPHDPRVDARIRLALLRVLMIQGRAVAAVARADELADGAGLDDRQRARAWTDAATARLLGGDLDGARRDAERALEAGTELDDDPAMCGALSALSWVENLRGRTREALNLGEAAVSLAASSPVHETGRRYPHCYLGVILMDADRLDDGLRMFDDGRRLAEIYGDTWQLPIHHWGAVLASFYGGRLEDAVAALETAEAVVTEVGTDMLTVWALALGAHVALRQDRLEVAEERLDTAERRVEQFGPGMGVDWMLWGRALLHEAQGGTSEAAGLLRSAWELAGSLGIVAQRRLIGPDLVRMLMADGDETTARRVADAMDEVAAIGGLHGARAAAMRCQAMVDRDPEAAQNAVALHRAGPRRLEHADTCLDAAQLLVDGGRKDEARELLLEAASLFTAAGAARDIRRVDAELRGLGVARGRREPRSRPKVGWEALTPTELEVTRLVAEGMTNPQVGQRLFISPRTVETHLSNVFGKLGVTSRVELAVAASRRPEIVGGPEVAQTP